MARYVLIFASCVLPVLFGVYFIAIALTRDVTAELKSLNDFAKIKKNRSMAMKQLCEFIDFHSTAKQFRSFTSIKIIFLIFFRIESINCSLILLFLRFVEDLSDLFQPFFMMFFALCLVLISSTMLFVQIELVEYFWKIITIFN